MFKCYVFMLAEASILSYFWVFFWAELPKILSTLFEILTSDDMQDDASDMLRFLLKYYDWNWTKKLIFWLILRGFLYISSDTLWVTPQDFAKLKTLLRYIFVVSFISITYVVLKLKIFKVFWINSASMQWFFLSVFGLLLPLMLFDLAEILTRGCLQ